MNTESVRMRGFMEYTKVNDALNRIITRIQRSEPETVPVTESLGRILYEDIYSPRNIPHFDRSAMDGYAVIAEDTFGASQHSPIKLKVIGEVRVGKPPNLKVSKMEAAQIATGAPIPSDADAVVMVEYTKRIDGEIEVYSPVTPGKNVSKLGEDVKKGQKILSNGKQIRPQEETMLLQCGIAEVKVAKRPRVAIVSSGSELVDIDKAPELGQVISTNSYTLASMVRVYGGEPKLLGIVPDIPEELERAIEEALKYDMGVFSGGTSVGKYDYLPDLLEKKGELIFHGVAMKPGSPTAVSFLKGKPIFSLPGYPVATMMAFIVFVAPSIRKMLGAEKLDPRIFIEAKMSRKVASTLGRRDFVRVKIEETDEGILAVPLRAGGSGVVSSMVNADGIVEIPENVEGINEGERVRVALFPHIVV
ncbi:MAG: molybdopterin molybdotransferase MoeA [Candidatus Jordarchaeum sp.]|uniref:molybdopterin molybdotransferase MoeA n=1 Tax=Candidatus Jordarchaeum sp. TaxID=2823881 RepID=UPI0040497A39